VTVLIRDGRISDVFRTDEQTIPAGATIRDLSGHYLIPGLINSHVHLSLIFSASRGSGLAVLEQMLYAGVTTVREMVGDTRLTAEVARTSVLGTRPLPTIQYAALVAGPTFFALRADSDVAEHIPVPSREWSANRQLRAKQDGPVARLIRRTATGTRRYERVR
jgi:hypothetical protein